MVEALVITELGAAVALYLEIDPNSEHRGLTWTHLRARWTAEGDEG